MQGEYIAPEKIENIYMTSEIVGQVMIYGDTLKVGPGCFSSITSYLFSIFVNTNEL